MISAACPRPIHACAVCFGADGDVGKAYTWGVAVMLGATFSIMASLIYAAYRMEKRKAQADARTP